MAIVSIKNIQVGLITSAPVLTPQGRRLLESGVELSENHIKQLKAWGIPEVMVIGGEGSDTTDEADQESLMHLRKKVERFFPDSEESPLMEVILKKVCCRRQVHRQGYQVSQCRGAFCCRPPA